MTVKSGDLYHYEATCRDKKNERIRLDIVSEKIFDKLNPSNCSLTERGFSNVVFYEVSMNRLEYLKKRKGSLSILV